MWNHREILLSVDDEVLKKFKKYSKIGGVIFIILGLIGILFPSFITFSMVLFLAYLMLFAGLSSAWITWVSNRSDWIGWLKSLVFVGMSLFMLFYPLEGVATLGLLFSIYFFMDAFTGFSLAFSASGKKHRWLWGLNALGSLILGVVVLLGFPFTTVWLIGFLIGIGLLLDGIALLFGASILGEEALNNR
jgi:uncharacterized membrane protein HdeD (DUF308 family)